MSPRAGEGRGQTGNKKASSKTRIPTNGRQHSFTNMSRLPLLREVQSSQRTELFIRKCKVCETHYKLSPETLAPSISEILLDTFSSGRGPMMGKPREGEGSIYCMPDDPGRLEKERCLEDIIKFLGAPVTNSGAHKAVFTEECYFAIMSMVETNIFRCPPLKKIGPSDTPDEEDEPQLENSWPHLVLVYGVLQKFVESPDFQPSVAKKYITVSFVQQLLQLFASDDPRERCSLKTLLHRIYGKFLGLRPVIRRHINYIFLEFIYEHEQNSGIPELLEILGSIINGFAVPLKQEHITMLRRTLIPLHKSKSLGTFYAQLVYCIVQFIEKEPSLTEEIVFALLRLWPHQCSGKQVMLLGEFEEICDVIDPKMFENIFQPLVSRIALCMASSHFQVSERALCFWNNEYVISLLESYANIILPMILPHLIHVSEHHWNRTIGMLSIDTCKMLHELDPIIVGHVLTEMGKIQILEEMITEEERA